MIRKLSNPQPAGDEAACPERKGRRLIWLGAAGIAALMAAVVYVNLGPSRALRVAKETTYITEPLKPDGKQVDYFAAIRQATRPDHAATDENGYRLIVRHLGKAPETEPEQFARICEELGLDATTLRPDMTYREPHEFLDAYVDSAEFDVSLLDALPPHHRIRWRVVSMLEAKLGAPWTLEELPMAAAWLEQNGPALDLVARAIHQPTFYIPLATQRQEDPLHVVLRPELGRMKAFARGLATRANHRIAAGDINGAIDDIIACKRLGRQVGHGPFLHHLLAGVEIERIADAVGIAGSLEHPPTKEQLERLLAEKDNLPRASNVESTALAQRLYALDVIQSTSHGEGSCHELVVVYDTATRFLFNMDIDKFRVDWNVLARRFNARLDDSLATGRPPRRPELTLGQAIPLVSMRARSEFLAEWLAWSLHRHRDSLLEAARRAGCAEQMQRIVLAMLLYERDHGTLPPAWSADAAGNPLHSWRVLLLPYLGHGELYDRIRLDEPWDSPHNRQFHGEAVSFYRCPRNPLAEAGETTYSVVVGPDLPFEAGEGKRLADSGPLSDDMILLVERTDPVGWMDPTREVAQADAELGIYPQETGRPTSPGRIGSWHRWHGSSNFGLRNGAVRFLVTDIGGEQLEKMLRGANAEKIVDY